MGSKGNRKKGNKAQAPRQGRQGLKRPLVSPIVVTRTTAPTTPIPALATLALQPELKTMRGGTRTVKKWCFDNTPVYYTPNEPWPSTSLNKGAVVQLTGQNCNVSADDVKSLWLEVAYEIYDPRTGTQWVTGWVNDVYLDDYNEKFPDSGVGIPNPTPSPTDAQQYMILEGKVRYNLCGELCVAFLVGDDIDSVLVKWKRNSPGSYNGILAGGRDNPTSENDLKNMLGAVLGEYGYGCGDDQLISLRNTLTYPITPAGLLDDLKKMLPTHCLISGVTISDAGELIGKENPRIKHWVVLDKLTYNGNRVEIYNPFPNRREEFSFTEFYRSCSTNSGVWVKREKASSSSRVQNAPVFEVAIANPNPLYRAAQYIDVDGRKKTNLCGEFCVAFVIKESINTVLEHWKEVQPILYADIVGNNKGTGTFALTTILKSYGYNSEGDIKEFLAGLTDPYLKKSLVSPGRIAKLLETYFLIAGVNIDGLTGRLKPGDDVRHWVVVDKLTPVGKNRGWVELYNPFPNSWEEYSYREFTASAGYWSGLWVKRDIIPVYVPQVVEGSHAEDHPQKDGRIGQWTEGQLLAAIRRRSKSGRPVNKIAAELAELSGWKKREILSRFKKIIVTGKTGISVWTETQLRQEIVRRLRMGKPANKISAELTGKSGWKKREIVNVIKSAIEAEKWTEAQLLEALSETLKNAKSTNKVATELTVKSGWKKREIISRIKKLIAARKWTEDQLRAEMEKRLKTGRSLSKVSRELAETSGWKIWQVSKILKALKDVERAAGKKVHKTLAELVVTVDPNTIVQASKPLAEFVEWQNNLLAVPGSNLYRIRKWGDPIMVKYGFDVNQVGTSNFQAVGLYNDGKKEFGAISNYLHIPHEDVIRLRAMQIEDEYEAKSKAKDWRRQKMNWLCKPKGTIYFYHHQTESGDWDSLSYIAWGTLALGGNLVQVQGTETVHTKMRDGIERDVEVARLKGFRPSDWNRSLDDLLAEGLVHRCFCAYKSNHFGDSPKGIVYSPFYSVADWEFVGKTSPGALYIPVEWLEPKGS